MPVSFAASLAALYDKPPEFSSLTALYGKLGKPPDFSGVLNPLECESSTPANVLLQIIPLTTRESKIYVATAPRVRIPVWDSQETDLLVPVRQSVAGASTAAGVLNEDSSLFQIPNVPQRRIV